MKHPLSRARGFTLLEVMIALAIVALSIGALLGSVSSSASNVIYLRDKTMAEWVALNRLTEIRTWKVMPPEGKRTGFAEMGGLRWQWEQDVQKLPINGMFRIEVRARPTAEPAKATATTTKNTQQKEPESKTSGTELEKVAWTTTVTGIIGTSNSDRQQPIAFQYASSQQLSGGPRGPNNPNGPNAPGSNPANPSNPSNPGNPANPGNPTLPPVTPPTGTER